MELLLDPADISVCKLINDRVFNKYLSIVCRDNTNI